MSTSIADLRDMNDALLAACKAEGIKTVDELTDALAEPAARKAWAEKTGQSTAAILTLANRADLSRINGVGGAYSDLLEASGVDTVKELAHRRADNLHQKITEVNAEKSLTQRPPTQAQVEDWIAQAKTLGGKINY